MKIWLYILCWLTIDICKAQTTACPENIDFEDGNMSHWSVGAETGNSSYFSPCCSSPATATITNSSMPNDSYSNLPVTAPNGSSFSVKLGDWGGPVPATINQMQRQIPVTANNRFLTYNYSISMLACKYFDPWHSASAIIFFLDQYGDTIPCSKQYYNTSDGNISGCIIDSVSLSPYILCSLPWQSKTLDFSSYIGQNITAFFMVRTCFTSLHRATMYVDVVCNNQSQTAFCASTGGTLCAPDNCSSYTWTAPSGSSSSVRCITPMEAGVYTVEVPAQKGCLSTTSSITYTVDEKPVSDFTFQTSCQSQDYTFNQQSVMGNTTVCHTDWKIDNTAFTTPAVNYHFSTPGNYTVSLLTTDCSTRCRDSVTKTITVLPPVKALFNHSEIMCTGDSILFANASVESSPSTYTWDFNGSQSFAENPKVNFSQRGTYTVKLVVRDVRGCKDSIVKSIVISDYPEISIHTENGCINASCHFHAEVLNGLSVDKWEWDLQGDGIIDALTQKAETVYYWQGSFPIKLSATSIEGCTTTKTSMVSVYPLPHAAYAMNISASPLISFTNTSTSPANSQIVSNSWNFGEGFTETNLASEFAYPYTQPGSYRPLLNVTNNFGCSDTISQPIVIVTSYAVYIPNAFTPNGDNLNDLFKIEYFGIAESELTIFDRWGQMIYTSKDKDAGWDGTGKHGNDYKQDVYVWKLVYREYTGAEHYSTGSVSLVR